jgi:phage-related protein
MTVEELEIIIKANISDAVSGIKQITNEVKNAVSKSVEPMKKLTEQAKNMASNSSSSVSQMKKKMKDYGKSINETSKQEEYLKSKIADLKEQLNMADNGFEVGDTMKIEAEIEKLENRLRKLEEQSGETGEKTSSIFEKIKEKIKHASNNVSSFKSKLKNLLTNSKDLGKSFSNTFNNGIKSIKKFALSLLSVRTAFSMISKAMSSYLSYDTQLSDSIQNCWNVLGSLLAPILERLVSMFATLVAYVNAFVKSLSGIDLVARANAKALNKQASASKNASKQLSSLDDLNNLTTNDGGGNSNQNPITVDNVSLDGLMDKILNYDWYSVGLEIGKKINEALAGINWDFIQTLAVSLAKDLANFLNGLVDGLDWSLIGKTLGNGINTVLMSVYTFMTTFNWLNLGTSIATGINNAIGTIDWNLLGKTLASKFVAIIDTLYGFVNNFNWSQLGSSISEAFMGFWNEIDWSRAGETISNGIRGLFTSVKEIIAGIDWQQLGNDVWTFIAGIDWGGMISNLAYILGQAIAGIGQFIWGFIEDAVKSISEFWSEKFDEAGGNIIQGLFNGILEIFGDIGSWLKKNIVDPFINGFKSMFGIHSPSTVMKELGIYILEGLKNGLVGIWDKVKDIFENLKTNITTKFTETLNKIKSIFSISAIKSHFTEVLNGIKNVFSSIPTWFKDKFTQAWTNVKNVFSSGGKIFSGIKEGIESTFKTIVNKIISGINTIVAKPFNAINNMLNKIRNTEFLGIAPFKGLWSQNPLSVPVIPSLANGGVLTEETLVRVAEYSNARSNPEIVSPANLMDSIFRSALSDTNLGTRVDRLVIKFLDENVYDGAIEYINEQSRIKGVSVIKEVD